MPYSEELADLVRPRLGLVKKMTERQMFGGLAFMVAGNMAVGVVGHDLMVRVGPDLHHDALTRPHAREMDFTGRPMKGMVYVDPDGWRDDAELDLWVRLGVAYATSLPAKAVKKTAKKKTAPAKAAKKAAKNAVNKTARKRA